MKQILQNLGSGETLLAEVPAPGGRAGCLLIRSEASLVSIGTERMLVSFGQANLLEKARQQPEKVKQVLQKIRTDGLFATIDAVRAKLDQPVAMGYCSCGRVMEVGTGVQGFVIGDIVVSNGPHAEVVSVAKNLCARVPDGVPTSAACFTPLASVALQGVRLVAPTLGENVVVLGLGLVGLLTVQILRANGARVLGIDLDARKAELARSFGAEAIVLASGEAPVEAATAWSGGHGVDAVIICASTASSDPVRQAAQMSRQRGRIVLVGVTGLELNRADFYEKELTFQVSCSYGPGRYDPAYEQGGQDYPVGFVRWTEQRNFAAVLELMRDGRLNAAALITARLPFADALKAYQAVLAGGQLGVVLEYGSAGRLTGDPGSMNRETGPAIGDSGSATGGRLVTGDSGSVTGAEKEPKLVRTIELRPSAPGSGERPVVSVIGAGNYAGRVLLPALHATGADLRTLVSSGGTTCAHFGRKYGFARASTDVAEAINDPAIHGMVIATRHDSHASLALAALRAGKHVFVEKPLCLSLQDLQAIERVLKGDQGSVNRDSEAGKSDPRLVGSERGAVTGEAPTEPNRESQVTNHAPSRIPFVMVGFNRRFAPHVMEMKRLLAATTVPKAMVVTVNAGGVPEKHWTHDAAAGGGRVLGEGIHFVDLLRHLAGSSITAARISRLKQSGREVEDVASIQLEFADGSTGTIHYLANGDRSFPKERIEVFCAGRVLQLDNFRRLRSYGWSGLRVGRLWRQDKGHSACIAAWVDALRRGGPSPIPWKEIEEVHRCTFRLAAATNQHDCPPRGVAATEQTTGGSTTTDCPDGHG